MTVDEWLKHLPVNDYHKENIVLGLVSAMNGCSLDEARSFSVREGMAFVSRALPSNPLRSIYYFNCKKGLGGVVDRLASECKNLKIYTSSEIKGLKIDSDNQTVFTDRGEVNSDHLVFACPPHASAKILNNVPNTRRLVNNLQQFSYFKSKLALHTDPIYMHKQKKYWSIYNTRVENNYCGASVWYSKLLRTRHNFFKSWVTGRHQDPRVTLHEREYLHPKIDMNFLAAQRGLVSAQGDQRVWFAGSYTHDVDSQDTALMSAVNLGKQLAPNSPRLKRFT